MLTWPVGPSFTFVTGPTGQVAYPTTLALAREIGAADGETDEKIVECAGKMKLLDRLLPKLKKGGHKVLIFSQMTKVLSILEDYLIMRDYGYRRIDGNVQWQDRQRFMVIARGSATETGALIDLCRIKTTVSQAPEAQQQLLCVVQMSSKLSH